MVNRKRIRESKTNHDSIYDTSLNNEKNETEGLIVFMGDSNGRLSKAEKKIDRIKVNRIWKLKDRMPWSGSDPNPRHTRFYAYQIPEFIDEYLSFKNAMATGLPVTFRFSHNCHGWYTCALEDRLRREFRMMHGRFIEAKGEVVKEVAHPIGWAPGAWQVNIDKSSFGKSEALSELHTLIKSEELLGHVVRQELVSMIPVMLLDVRSQHFVLDICAAPGSKTEQIIDRMHADVASGSGWPSGVVVANDADPKRIEKLKTRYARCPHVGLVLSCARAQDLQTAIAPSGGKFDRILCDVPCSGDGTFRKLPHLWRLFRPYTAIELHTAQLEIAVAAFELLRPGGRLVYSTCALNPFENEAVVAALLAYSQGRLRLLDVRALPDFPSGLITRPGLTTWRCDEECLLAGQEGQEREDSKRLIPAIPASLLPPEDGTALRHCLRIYPQDQNTGGFFVAVLQLAETAESNSNRRTHKQSHSHESQYVDVAENTLECLARDVECLNSGLLRASEYDSTCRLMERPVVAPVVSGSKKGRTASDQRGPVSALHLLSPGAAEVLRDWGMQHIVGQAGVELATAALFPATRDDFGNMSRSRLGLAGALLLPRELPSEQAVCWRLNKDLNETCLPALDDRFVVRLEAEDLVALVSRGRTMPIPEPEDDVDVVMSLFHHYRVGAYVAVTAAGRSQAGEQSVSEAESGVLPAKRRMSKAERRKGRAPRVSLDIVSSTSGQAGTAASGLCMLLYQRTAEGLSLLSPEDRIDSFLATSRHLGQAL